MSRAFIKEDGGDSDDLPERPQNGGAERVFEIVGQDEAEEGGRKLSWDSALALALIGAKPGATLELPLADGASPAVVASVSYPARP